MKNKNNKKTKVTPKQAEIQLLVDLLSEVLVKIIQKITKR